MKGVIQRLAVVLASASFVLSPPAAAQQQKSEPNVAAAGAMRIPASEHWDMKSKITGRTYRIFVSKPLGGRAPSSGSAPIFYVLDGNLFFQTASEAAWAGAMGPQVKPAWVVGIGYPTDDLELIGVLRGGDLAPHAEELRMKEHAEEFGETEAGEIGAPLPSGIPPGEGAESFFRFIKEELQPRLIAKFGPLDTTDTTLWGHSLGGLFVLETLFNHPDAFHSYVASSPSIWFQNRRVLQREAAFVQAMRDAKAKPRVLIFSGGNEEKPYPKDQPLPAGLPPEITREYIDKLTADGRMIGNARELAERLGKVQGLAVQFHLFEDEDHGSMCPASIGRAVTFGLAKPGFYGNAPAGK